MRLDGFFKSVIVPDEDVSAQSSGVSLSIVVSKIDYEDSLIGIFAAKDSLFLNQRIS